MSVYISEEGLRRLTVGSYEREIEASGRAVVEARVFGPDVACRVVGTFCDHVVVVAEDGRVARVWLSEERTVTKVCQEDVTVVAEGGLPTYVRAEVREALREWRDGRSDRARQRLERLAPLTSSPQLSEDLRSKGHEQWLAAPKTWGPVVENKDSMLRFLGHKTLASLEAERPRPRHLDPLPQRIAYLTSRVAALQSSVDAAYEDVRDMVQVESSGNSTAGIQSFCRDLAQDVGILYRVLVDISEFRSVSKQGRLYDVVVAKLPAFEVAGRVAEEAARRLGKSGVSQ